MMNKYYVIYFLFILIPIRGSHKPTNNAWHNEKHKEDPIAQYYFGQYVLSQIEFKEHDIVLDIGCGNGKTTCKIAKKIPAGTVIGIDNNPEMLQQAINNGAGLSNTTFKLVDATKFQSNRSVTKIVAICSLSWMPNQQKTYECASEALVSGGTFTALVSDAHDPIFVSYRKAMAKAEWQKYFKNYIPSFYPSTADDIRKYLALANLETKLLQSIELPSMKMNRNSFMEKLRANPGVKDAIPQRHYESFLNDVITEYIAQTKPVDENNIEVACRLFFFIAEKKSRLNLNDFCSPVASWT